jgi:hypothetical protein
VNEEPGGVPAGTGSQTQGGLRGLDPRLETDQVTDRLVDPPVEGDDEVDGLGPSLKGGQSRGTFDTEESTADRMEEFRDRSR